MIRKELIVFFTALSFYTRIPAPSWAQPSKPALKASIRHFPLTGWFVALNSALLFLLLSTVLPTLPALVLMYGFKVWFTGALHEDAWADICDGFGNPRSKNKTMEVMQDSRLGTFGVCGLAFLILLKLVLWFEFLNFPWFKIPWQHTGRWFGLSLQQSFFVIILWSGMSLSRLMVIPAMQQMNYIKRPAGSKMQLLTTRKLSFKSLVWTTFTGVFPLLLLQSPLYFLVVIPMGLVAWHMGRIFKQRLGGYTGDCLGAIQQATEITFYLSILILCRFT